MLKSTAIWTFPNILTMLRLLCIPILFIMHYISFSYSHIISAAIFLVGGITDWLDGFLARYFRHKSALGEFLDPIADKLMVSTALILLVGLYHHLLIVIPAVIIICREIIISSLRMWLAHCDKRVVLKVVYSSKVKTLFQMTAIFFLLLRPSTSNYFSLFIGFVLLYLAVFLTIYSMLIYLYTAYKVLQSA